MMDFGEAIRRLKAGERVAREGWNGKGMDLMLVTPSGDVRLYGKTAVQAHVLGLRVLPWIGMKTADDGFVPWLASQTDMLAEDWMVVS